MIEVQPLPLHAPEGFVPTNVGSWSLTSAVQEGQGRSLRVVLEGQGSLHEIVLPTLPPVPGIQASPPIVHEETSVALGRFGGRRVVEYPLTVERAGTFELPALTLQYFDLATGSYEATSTTPQKLDAEAATTAAAPAAEVSAAPASDAGDPQAARATSAPSPRRVSSFVLLALALLVLALLVLADRCGPRSRNLATALQLCAAAAAAALVAATVAFLSPRPPETVAPGAPARRQVEGIDLVIALDISTSMNALDFKPRNRITAAKEVVRTLVQRRPSDRIGLVAFAGEVYAPAALSTGRRELNDALEAILPGSLKDGTAIGSALAAAINCLCEARAQDEPTALHNLDACRNTTRPRAIVLITDGENNSGSLSPMDAAAIAERFGVTVYTVLVGKGGLVDFPTGPDLFGGKTFRQVEIPVDPALLSSISGATAGRSFAANTKEDLERSISEIVGLLGVPRPPPQLSGGAGVVPLVEPARALAEQDPVRLLDAIRRTEGEVVTKLAREQVKKPPAKRDRPAGPP